MTGPGLTLDRVQRDAVRRDVTLDTTRFADLEIEIRRGDRVAALRTRERLDLIIGALDALGWTERPDAPDEQPVRDVVALARYAAARVPELEDPTSMNPATADVGTIDAALVAAHALRRALEANR